MGMDLQGKGGDFRFSTRDWMMVLRLAEEYDWTPMGTQPAVRRTLRPDLPQAQREAIWRWEEEAIRLAMDGETPKDFPPIPEDAWIEEPRDTDWAGGYDSNNAQFVTDEDAHNLADALERALPELRDYNVTDVKMRPLTADSGDPLGTALGKAFGGDIGVSYFGPAMDSEPIEWFSGEKKQKVIDFIAFCRAGAFSIG